MTVVLLRPPDAEDRAQLPRRREVPARGARFVYRIDDVTPTMNWKQFRLYLELFRRYGVRPLLGVVPDNQDPALNVGPAEPAFWRIIRELVEQGIAEVAQHGFQHRYVSRTLGMLGRSYGFSPNSEFAGLPYVAQLAKIRSGRRIVHDHGLSSKVWMAPSHSFDRVTLRALRATGFEAVTDGIGLYPYRTAGLVFVPQQLWSPQLRRFGVWTICLHINQPRPALYHSVERHVAVSQVISFSEATALPRGPLRSLVNAGHRAIVHLRSVGARVAANPPQDACES